MAFRIARIGDGPPATGRRVRLVRLACLPLCLIAVAARAEVDPVEESPAPGTDEVTKSASAGITADDPPPASPGPASDEPALYETAVVRERPLDLATASVTVLDREALAAHAGRSVAEVLPCVAGVHLTGGSGRGGVSLGQIRGGDPNFTVVLVDGVRVNDPTDTFGGGVNLSSLPVALVERIEVVRGPTSSSMGSPGLAGAIHIITRRPHGDVPTVDGSVEAGDAESVRASLSRGDTAGGFTIGAGWEREEENIARERFEQVELRGNWSRAFDERRELRLSGRVASWEADDYPEASGGPVLGTGETRRSDHDELGLAAVATLGGRQRIRLTAYRHDLDRTSPGIGFVVPASVEEARYTEIEAGWNVALVQTARDRLTAGVETSLEDGRNDSTLDLPPALGGPVDGSYSVDRATGAGFVEWLRERGRWLFELGARWDVPEDFDAELSPRIGAAYRFGEGTTRLRGSVGRAFKLPSFFVLASPPALGGNPDLEPETAVSADLELSHSFEAAGLRVALAGFYTRFEDLVDFDFDLFLNVNRDEVRARGGELQIDWRPGERWSLGVDVARQDVEDRATGRPLRHRPEWYGGARLDWSFLPRGHWEIDLAWATESRDEQIPVPDRDRTSGYAVFGSALRYRVARHWELRARVDNVLDEDYEVFIGFPGVGRRAVLGLRYGE